MSQTETLPENWLTKASWPRLCGHIKASFQLRTILKSCSRSRVPTDTFLETMPQLNSSFCLILLHLHPHWWCPKEPYPVSLSMGTSPSQRLFPMDLNLHYSSPFRRVGGLSLFACVSLSHTPLSLHGRTIGTLTHHVLQSFYSSCESKPFSRHYSRLCGGEQRWPLATTPSLQWVFRLIPHLLQGPIGSMILWDSTGKKDLVCFFGICLSS